MGRLRLYSRSTGDCQYDSAGGAVDGDTGERARTAARGGLLFYYDPEAREIWCHVDVTRDMPERFLARYDAESGEDLLSAFVDAVESETAAEGWSIPDRSEAKHAAFRSLPPTPPESPPEDAVTEIREIAAETGLPTPLVFGAPDYAPAMSLVEYFRNDRGRTILVSTNGAIPGFDPDVRIDLRPYLDAPEPIEETADWLDEHRFERALSHAKERVTTLRERHVDDDVELPRITATLRQHALAEVDAAVYTPTELRTRERRARRRAFRGVLALGVLVATAGVGFAFWQRLSEALGAPLALPVPVRSVSGYGLWDAFPATVTAVVPLLAGLVALVAGGGGCGSDASSGRRRRRTATRPPPTRVRSGPNERRERRRNAPTPTRRRNAPRSARRRGNWGARLLHSVRPSALTTRRTSANMSGTSSRPTRGTGRSTSRYSPRTRWGGE